MKVLLSDLAVKPSATVQWAFCISLAVALFAIYGLTHIMKEEAEDRSYIRPASVILLVSATLLIVLPSTGLRLGTTALLGTAAVLLFLPVCAGIVGWVRFKFKE